MSRGIRNSVTKRNGTLSLAKMVRSTKGTSSAVQQHAKGLGSEDLREEKLQDPQIESLSRPGRRADTRAWEPNCALSGALIFGCFWKIVAYKRIGGSANKKLSNIAAHVGELWCVMRLGTRFDQISSLQAEAIM